MPTPESVTNAVVSADGIASQFSKEQIINLCEKAIDDSVRRIVKVFDAVYVSCLATSSPYLPLVACAMIQLSFQHGICPESAVAFATFAMLKISLAEDYAGARYWADVVRAMEKKHQSISNKSSMQ